MEGFSCRQSLHIKSPGANGFTFLTTSHLMLKLMFLFFNFQTCSPNTGIHIEGKLIEKVQTFTYLGALMTEDGRSEKEIKRRINIAKRTFQQKSKLLTSHDLSYATKIRLVKCYIWATFLYGCETWTLTESIEKKITAFEM